MSPIYKVIIIGLGLMWKSDLEKKRRLSDQENYSKRVNIEVKK